MSCLRNHIPKVKGERKALAAPAGAETPQYESTKVIISHQTQFVKGATVEHRIIAEISRSALLHNLNEIRRVTPSRVCAVVKDDAYGHGAQTISKVLAEAGVDFFAVSNIAEAEEILPVVGNAEVLVFGEPEADAAEFAAAHPNVVVTATSEDSAKRLSQLAKVTGKYVRVHVKLDTGMSRVGLHTFAECERVCALPLIQAEAVYSHMSSADSLGESDYMFTIRQINDTRAVATRLGLPFHARNSAGVLFHPDTNAGEFAVRPGIILYGLSPNTSLKPPVSLKQVLTLKTFVGDIRTVNQGDFVSYGRTFAAEHDMTTVTLPFGYGDGYRRALGEGQIPHVLAEIRLRRRPDAPAALTEENGVQIPLHDLVLSVIPLKIKRLEYLQQLALDCYVVLFREVFQELLRDCRAAEVVAHRDEHI
jgi:alanine racemase